MPKLPPPPLWFQRFAAFISRLVDRTPWEVDRLLGLGVAGLGIVFYLQPREVVRYGFAFLRPIIVEAAIATFLIGSVQIVVGIKEWRVARQWAAFACFLVYAAISRNNESPSGEWIYGVMALGEALVVLKRY